MDVLTENKDLALYQRIDEILWFDWDPLGINDIAPRDEYKSYVIDIIDLVKAKADSQTIAQHLLKIEKENMGKVANIEKCYTVADKMLE